MKLIWTVFFSILNNGKGQSDKYVGLYSIPNTKGRTSITKGSTIELKSNKIVELRTALHRYGLKVYQGIWELKDNKICIKELKDIDGMPGKDNHLEYEIKNLKRDNGNDSILIHITDSKQLSTIYPISISINGKRFEKKYDDSFYIKRSRAFLVHVSLFGFDDSINITTNAESSDLFLQIMNDNPPTIMFDFPDINLLLKNNNILYRSINGKYLKLNRLENPKLR